MKKIYASIATLALSAVVANTVNAQVFTLEHLDNSNDTVFATGTPVDVKPTVRLKLETGIDSFKYTWKFVDFTMPTDWNATGVCDNVTCYPYTIGTNVNDLFKAPYEESAMSNWAFNDTAADMPSDLIYVWLNVAPESSRGVGVFRFNITTDTVMPLTAQPATDQVTEVLFVVKKDIEVSVKTIEVPENAIRLYPNPAINQISVAVADQLKIERMQIIDMQGKVLSNTGFNQTIDIESYNTGMYTVEFYNNEGIKLTSRKFVKQ